MAGISVAEVSQQSPARFPYARDDLEKLFASRCFSGPFVEDDDAAGPAQKWVPLLAAFTGARLEELAQLAVTDVKLQDGVHLIHFQVTKF